MIPPKLRKVYKTDGANTNNSLYVILWGFRGIDVSYQIVCSGVALYYDNGSGNTWTKIISLSKDVSTIIEKSKTYVISDEEKGFTAAL